MKKIILSSLIAFCSLSAFSQVGVGTTNPNNVAVLDATSTTQGVLLTRLTTSEMNAITSPADGLTVYNTDEKCLFFYNNTKWVSLCAKTKTSSNLTPLANNNQIKKQTVKSKNVPKNKEQ